MIHLKARYILQTIEGSFYWGNRLNVAHQLQTAYKILFWKNNLKKINKRVINKYSVPSMKTYSDASNTNFA